MTTTASLKTMDTLKIGLASLVLAALAVLARPAAAHSDHYAEGEIDRLLAPVALYPDTVLSHLLIAATYPDEVREAAAWSRRHPDLTGEKAVDAVERQDWDPSVKALVAFPELLARMDEDGEWMEHLGDAFLKQEGHVMDRVQYLRTRAYDSGHLSSTEHVHVIREREYIYIEPAVAHIIYVPYYDPWYVYGTWWWPAYPPYYWHTWYGRPYTYYRTGFYWGVSFRVAPAFYFTTFYWPQRHVVIVHDQHRRPVYSGRSIAREDVRRWHHRPERVERSRERRAAVAARGETEVRPHQHRDPRADRRTDAHERRDARREQRGDVPRSESRSERRDDRGPARAERRDRSDEVREQLRERRNEPRGNGEGRREQREESGRQAGRRDEPVRQGPREDRPDASRGEDRSEERRGNGRERDGQRDAEQPRDRAPRSNDAPRERSNGNGNGREHRQDDNGRENGASRDNGADKQKGRGNRGQRQDRERKEGRERERRGGRD